MKKNWRFKFSYCFFQMFLSVIFLFSYQTEIFAEETNSVDSSAYYSWKDNLPPSNTDANSGDNQYNNTTTEEIVNENIQKTITEYYQYHQYTNSFNTVTNSNNFFNNYYSQNAVSNSDEIKSYEKHSDDYYRKKAQNEYKKSNFVSAFENYLKAYVLSNDGDEDLLQMNIAGSISTPTIDADIFDLYRKLAQESLQGITESQLSLIYLSSKQWRTPLDELPPIFTTWLQKACLNGNVHALMALSKNYSDDTSFEFGLKVASEKGNSEANTILNGKISHVVIDNIILFNSDKDFKPLGDYGYVFDRKKIKFISLIINYTNTSDNTQEGVLNIKYIKPNGTIITTNNSSQGDYSIVSDKLILLKNQRYIYNAGIFSNYEPGIYTIEIWWNNLLIGKKLFQII